MADVVKEQPQQQRITLNEQQIRQGAMAALVVLNGAPPAEILRLTDDLVVAKLMLKALVEGNAALGSTTARAPGAAPAAPTPANPPAIPPKDNMRLRKRNKPR